MTKEQVRVTIALPDPDNLQTPLVWLSAYGATLSSSPQKLGKFADERARAVIDEIMSNGRMLRRGHRLIVLIEEGDAEDERGKLDLAQHLTRFFRDQVIIQVREAGVERK
jgi:hypothetical protein